MDKENSMPFLVYDSIKRMINGLNVVLAQIIPGLELVVKHEGKEWYQDAGHPVSYEIISKRNGREIPMRYESEGIKKLISILSLLIFAFNDESVTVVIDELDSGIFEYLLGEILKIIQEHGKGQLIFTSHNLRPLETLDKESIIFTTTNPNNRYIRLRNLNFNNNLRDTYFRSLIVGGQQETLYEPTHNSEIAFAFREAGDLCDL